MLSARQLALYTDLVNIWVKTGQRDAKGRGQSGHYVLVYSNIPCKFVYTPNIDSATDIGQQKEKTMLTLDQCHLPVVYNGQTLNIPNECVLVNVTQGNPNYGTVEKAQGAPNLLPGANRRANLNAQIVYVITEEHPPAEVMAGVNASNMLPNIDL